MPEPIVFAGAALSCLIFSTRYYPRLNPLTLHKANDQVYRVHAQGGEHVGNLKMIGNVWKFKAIGYAADGGVIPGGGPLTGRHNTTFAHLDEALINASLSVKLSAEP